jgi:hypothetical protein
MSQILFGPGTVAPRLDEPDVEDQPESDARQEIADLEDAIEELSESAERCRKIIRASKLAAGLGGVLVPITMAGFLTLPPLALIAGISAAVGGVALIGSTSSTLDELTASIRDFEARRDALIDHLSLRMIRITTEQEDRS